MHESSEYVKISLWCFNQIIYENISNTVSCDYLKMVLSKSLLNEDNFSKLPIETISTDLKTLFSKSLGESSHVILDKAGPSLNMKITGNHHELKIYSLI